MCDMTQMASRWLFKRLLIRIVVIIVALLTIYLWTRTVVSCCDTITSRFWFSYERLSLSVFVPQPSGDVKDMQLLVQGPPRVAADRQPSCPSRLNNDDADRETCRPLLAGDNSSTTRPVWAVISDTEYIQRASNCDCFRSDLGYFVSPEDTTEDERRFPIAFSLLTYENLEQTERLLRLIYRPHNFYCIHVDEKSPTELHEGLEAIASCLDNVFIAKPPIDICWANISIVNAEILCIRQLLSVHRRWKYFINLVGRDFPLRTNYELVKILQAYDGANDIAASRKKER